MYSSLHPHSLSDHKCDKRRLLEIDAHMSSLEHKYEQLISHQVELEETLDDPVITESLVEIDDCLKNIESTSRIAKLWINFLKSIDLILQFIFAERSGN